MYDKTFLGIYVDSTLSLKLRIENITHKLSASCCAVRSVIAFLSQETPEGGLPCLFLFYYEMWINILGELL